MPRKTYRKVITSSELIESINPKNKKLMNLFIKDKERKCSIKTIENYRSDLNIFFCWNKLYNEDKFYPDIKKFEMSEFFSYCVDELKWAGKRFARMRSVLSGLSDCVIKFFDDEYPTFRNFINSVIEAIPKNPVREKTVLSDDEINMLLKTLKDSGEVQQACFFALAIYSGSRIAELEQFTIDTIDENNTAYENVMLETTHKIRTKGFGKEGKQLYKYIIKDLFLPYYHAWIEERARILKEVGREDEKALFINSKGLKASQGVFRDWAEKWEEIVHKPVYIHCLRHFMVTNMLKMGLTGDYVVAIIGWADGSMLKVYNDLEDKNRIWKDSSKLKEIINIQLNKEYEEEKDFDE